MSVIIRRRIVWWVLALILIASVATLSVSSAGLNRLAGVPWRSAQAPQLVTWSSFAPVGWLTSVPAASSIIADSPAGLDPATGAYAVSTDGGNSWSAWTQDNLSVTGQISTTQTLQVGGLILPDSAANNLIRYRIQEIGGGTETSGGYVIAVDATAPAAPLNLTATPGAWTKINSFALTWTNPGDAAGIAGAWYKVGSAPTSPTDGIYTLSPNTISGISLPDDGVHAVYVWLQDTLGRANPQSAASAIIYLDRVAPAAPFALRGQPAYTWTNVNAFSESWTNPSDPSGITGAYYQLNEVPDSPFSNPTRVDTPTSIAQIAVPGDGKHDLYLWLIDGAGNSSSDNWAAHPRVFWYDGTPPTSSAVLTPQAGATGWYTTTVTATFAGEDQADLSGLQGVYWRLDGAPENASATADIVTEGAHTLVYYSRDTAGNQEWAKQLDFSIDRTPPTATLQASSLPPASGWYTTPVTFTLTVTDGVSGPGGGYYRLNGGPWQASGSFTLATDGLYQVDFYGVDLAGNSTSIESRQVKMDAQPPSTASKIEETPGANGWYTSPLTVKLFPADGGSGVAATYYRINNGAWQAGTEFPLTADGIYSLSFYSVDASGNVESSFPVEVKLDSSAPAAPSAIETTPGGWSRINSFTVKWASPTDLSGLAGVYYRLNQEPTHARDGTYAPLTARLEGLTVPSEGVHRLYLWLQDNAGNADTKNMALAPLLRYDATAPDTQVSLQGLAGEDGWYRSPVVLTIKATDIASGVKVLNYRVNAGQWISTTQASAIININQADKHVIEYNAEDAAGNVTPVKVATVRLDMTPPAAPLGLTAAPSGWHRFNSFGLTWLPALDQSGIAGVYVKVGAAPTGPTDGAFFAGASQAGGIRVPAEGKQTLWAWLRDGAGNADHQTAVALTEAAWYDGSPPVTTVVRAGTLGANGWHRTPVVFSMSAMDATSGVAEIRHQVDDGEWIAGDGFVLADAGVHTVRVAAVDHAGNTEPAQVFEMKLDMLAPQAHVMAPINQEETTFEVQWEGTDATPGSGLAAYDVQWRDGYDSAWQSLRSNTTQTSAPFEGQRGHTYFFRVMAMDVAGNRQDPPSGARVTIAPLRNGRFNTGNFDSWNAAGILYKAVVPADGTNSAETLVARLGTDAYGASLTDPGNVPVGAATISQQVRIPDADQMHNTCLSLAYRVFTYDVMYSQRLGRYVDTLDVTLVDAGNQETLLLRAGNPTSVYGQFYDTGWRRARIDLRPWTGQTVTLSFSNFNRYDNLLNTWSYVDDIVIGECQPLFLPAVMGAGNAGSAAAASLGPQIDAPPADLQVLPDERR